MLGWQDFTLILDDLGTLCLESGHAAMLEVMWQVPKAKSSVQAVMVGDAGNLAFCSEKEMCSNTRIQELKKWVWMGI